MLRGYRIAIAPVVLGTMALLLLPIADSSAWAHRIGRHHRHHHARRAIVVTAPVRMVRPVVIAGRAHGVIDFNVTPKQTEIFVDGKLRGQVDDFDGYPGKLHLLPGTHKIILVTPDGEKYKRKVKVLAGHEMNLNLDLNE